MRVLLPTPTPTPTPTSSPLEEQTSIIKWKGLTYNEIIPTFRRNRNSNASTNNIFLPNPCTIYRRELTPPFSGFTDGCTIGRSNIKISELEQPGFSNRTSVTGGDSCDIKVPTPLKRVCNENSLRRIRSAGMNPERQLFISDTKIGTTYYTNCSQYLKSSVDSQCQKTAYSNAQFSCQGAVSYSNYIVRKQYDTNRDNNAITAATYKSPILYAQTLKGVVGDTGSLCANHTPL